eukprot:m.1065214 g.1065214  ORF g.1065214 m.1065214 type:complete len:124 (-) comp24219_c1_seq3:831-1202(-)
MNCSFLNPCPLVVLFFVLNILRMHPLHVPLCMVQSIAPLLPAHVSKPCLTQGQGVFSPPSSPPIQRARLRRQAKAKREEVSTTANEVQQTQRSQNVFTTLLKVIFVCFMAYVLVVLDRIQGQR